MEAVVSYQLLRHQISLVSFSLPVYLSHSLSISLPHSFFFLSLYFSLIMGEDKGLCGPFILSHSERWPQCTVGNRIQLCCRRCLSVCVSAGVNMCRNVCVRSCRRAASLCRSWVHVNLFCVILTAMFLFYPEALSTLIQIAENKLCAMRS